MWMLGFFAFFNRAASLYLFLAACTLGWISEMLKMYYADGRPFYMVVGPNIEGYNCEDIDFGRPSPHIFQSASIFILIYLQYFDPHDIRGSSSLLYMKPDNTFDEEEYRIENHYKNRDNAMCSILTSILLGMLVLFSWFSEVITGSNSIDQVLLGSSLGVGFCMLWYLL